MRFLLVFLCLFSVGSFAQASAEQAAIQIKMDGAYRDTCSAVVIDAHWILSAAHCTAGVLPTQRNMRVRIKNEEFARNIRLLDWKILDYKHGGTTKEDSINDLAFFKTAPNMLDLLGITKESLPSLADSPQTSVVNGLVYGFTATSIPFNLAVELTPDIPFLLIGKSLEEGRGLCTGNSGSGIFSDTGQLIGIVSGISTLVGMPPAPCGHPNSRFVIVDVGSQVCTIEKVTGLKLSARCPRPI